MPICSNRLGSQGESSKETTDIAMWESRWCQLCHRFRSLQDFCCCFLFAKIHIERRAMAGMTTKNAMFFEVRASWIILGYFDSHAWIMSRRNRIHPACTQTVSPWHGKDHYDYQNDTKWSLLFTFRFWYLLTWFVVGCFEGFFSPSMGQVPYQT